MPRQYRIADLEIGGNVIQVDITAEDDGGLTVFDLSYGPTADMCYGEGRDVEEWLEVTPDATRELSVKLFCAWIDDPANCVAWHLSENFKGDSQALNKIRELLDHKGVPYERQLWT